MSVTRAIKKVSLLGGDAQLEGHGTYQGEDGHGFDEWHDGQRRRKPKTTATLSFGDPEPLVVNGIPHKGWINFKRDQHTGEWRINHPSWVRRTDVTFGAETTNNARNKVENAALAVVKEIPHSFWSEAEMAAVAAEAERVVAKAAEAEEEAAALRARARALNEKYAEMLVGSKAPEEGASAGGPAVLHESGDGSVFCPECFALNRPKGWTAMDLKAAQGFALDCAPSSGRVFCNGCGRYYVPAVGEFRPAIKTKSGVDLMPCRFTIDGENGFDGFTNDTHWNGFLNVWVTAEEHKKVKALYSDDEESREAWEAAEAEGADEAEDGTALVCYGWGMTTYEVRLDCEQEVV